MNDRVYRVRLWSVLTVFCFGLFVWLPQIGSADLRQPVTDVHVHFLDVGQGDATFIETPEGIQVLIDGGRDTSVLRELGDVMSMRDRYIDIVVATHPDLDHIGGLIDVLERYEIGTILLTENAGESDAAETFQELVTAEGAHIIYARAGQRFAFGTSTHMEVLFPEINPAEMESNAASIALKFTHEEIDFLLTGDSPKRIEEYLVLAVGGHLQSEVLKVGHHGSRTSTAEIFLDEVQPEYAVISAGRDNRYGHPHVEVTDLLFNFGVETLSTAESGRIKFSSDGTEVQIE